MSNWFGRSLVAALAMLAVTGCGGGGSGGSDNTFPQDTLEIGGVRVPTEPPADVFYASASGGSRWIRIVDTDGAYVELAFVGEGDPSVPAYDLPDNGRWTGFDSEFVGLTICEPHIACRSYSAGDSIQGEMDLVGNTVSQTLGFGGAFGLNNGITSEVVVWSYSGDYSYQPAI